MSDRKNIRVLIVDDIIDTRDNLSKLLLFERDIEVVGTAANGLQAVDMTGQFHPDVVLMDIHMPEMDGVAAAEAIRNKWPEIQVIMMSVHGDAEYLRRAMIVGAREFLVKPFTSEELSNSIRRVASLTERLIVANPVPEPHDEPSQTSSAPSARGRIVTVFSPKGGIGCTTIACNLAVALALRNTKRVALVDCSLQFADVGLFLNLQANTTMVDLIPHIGSLDSDVLNSVMASHESGVKALLGPPRPEMAELITADTIKTVLGKLRESFDVIIVDTWPSLQETMLAVLDASDHILTVLSLDIPAIKNVKMFLEVAEVLGYPSDKIALVLNRGDSSNGGIDIGEVERNLNRRIATSIVNDVRVVAQAVNKGVPFVTAAKDSKVAKAIQSLADYVERGPAGSDSSQSVQNVRKGAEPSLGRVLGALRFGRSAEPRRV